tara:strand:+ start:152 stop:739 length:588 start_codon:yes stop_codon:yes gene_type:complete
VNDTLIAAFGSFEFYFDATLLVAISGVVWTLARRLAQLVFFQMALRTRTVELTFHANADVPPEISALKLLVIRYGNDLYLKELASDQERHHGRLRNRVQTVEIKDVPDGGKLILARLRIHKRLGTQFKFFVDVEGDAAPVVAHLKTHDAIKDVDVTPRPVRNGQDKGRKRLFFLVADFEQVKTIEGFTNNMIYPV